MLLLFRRSTFSTTTTTTEISYRSVAMSNLLRSTTAGGGGGTPSSSTTNPSSVGSLRSLTHLNSLRRGTGIGNGASRMTKSRSFANLSGKGNSDWAQATGDQDSSWTNSFKPKYRLFIKNWLLKMIKLGLDEFVFPFSESPVIYALTLGCTAVYFSLPLMHILDCFLYFEFVSNILFLCFGGQFLMSEICF